MNVSWKADGKTRPTVLVEVPFATRGFRSEKCSLTEITFAERKLPTNAKVFSTRGAPRTLLSQILKFSLPPKSRMKIRLLMKMCLPSKCRTPISEFRSDCAINRRCAQVYHCLRRRVLVFGMRQRRIHFLAWRTAKVEPGILKLRPLLALRVYTTPVYEYRIIFY